jgi:hypothetical protein
MKSPAAKDVTFKEFEQVVVRSMPTVPPVFEQAIAPEAAVDKAPLSKLVFVTPCSFLGRAEGVPASALIVTSRTVASPETKHWLPCGPMSTSAKADPLSAPMTMEQVRRWSTQSVV